jgi:hypothetical protein
MPRYISTTPATSLSKPMLKKLQLGFRISLAAGWRDKLRRKTIPSVQDPGVGSVPVSLHV